MINLVKAVDGKKTASGALLVVLYLWAKDYEVLPEMWLELFRRLAEVTVAAGLIDKGRKWFRDRK